jgi:DNA-binding NtrC family response regulator
MRNRSSIAFGPGPGASVLVVEPETATREALLGWLLDAGYRVQGARSFQAGRRILAATTPDLLIADLRLGAYNGLHLVISARAVNPALHAIVMTGADDTGLQAEARAVSAGYLVKPVSREAFVGAVVSALSDRESA